VLNINKLVCVSKSDWIIIVINSNDSETKRFKFAKDEPAAESLFHFLGCLRSRELIAQKGRRLDNRFTVTKPLMLDTTWDELHKLRDEKFKDFELFFEKTHHLEELLESKEEDLGGSCYRR
jgi:hypothetical protein